MLRRISPAILILALEACAHTPTPAAQTCNVVRSESQLDACDGKSVTIRGKVVTRSPPTILGVVVDAGADLTGKTAHASGTLRKDGAAWRLETNGALAKAHATN